jgi:hypothetical protein
MMKFLLTFSQAHSQPNQEKSSQIQDKSCGKLYRPTRVRFSCEYLTKTGIAIYFAARARKDGLFVSSVTLNLVTNFQELSSLTLRVPGTNDLLNLGALRVQTK